LIYQLWSGHYPSLMITLLLHLLRLLPFLCAGQRQLALENLALCQQLAVYKRTVVGRKNSIHRPFLLAGRVKDSRQVENGGEGSA
jgi:hypothetical protein